MMLSVLIYKDYLIVYFLVREQILCVYAIVFSRQTLTNLLVVFINSFFLFQKHIDSLEECLEKIDVESTPFVSFEETGKS